MKERREGEVYGKLMCANSTYLVRSRSPLLPSLYVQYKVVSLMLCYSTCTKLMADLLLLLHHCTQTSSICQQQLLQRLQLPLQAL